MVQRLLYVLISLSLVIPNPSWAWGNLGHETVAVIALQHLNEKAKAEINRILGYDITTDPEQWSQEASWADRAKLDPKWKHMSPYHYADHEQGKSYWNTPLASEGDAFRALLKFLEAISFSDSTTPLEDKKTALRMIMHLVGDLHQPLHTGEKENKGGNTINVGYKQGYECPKDELIKYDNDGYKLNLHSLWDHIVPRYDYYMNCENAVDIESPAQYAVCLESRFSDHSFEISRNMQEWMDQNEKTTQDYIMHGDLMAIDEAYMSPAAEQAGLAIYLAGIRLARTLDDVLTQGISSDYWKFAQIITKTFGYDSFDFFKLQPQNGKSASKEKTKKAKSSSK